MKQNFSVLEIAIKIMFLKNHIYNFYPSGQKEGYSEDYINTTEYRNLIRLINKANEWDTRELKNSLITCGLNFFNKDNFQDVTNFNFNDRSFNFQFKLRKEKNLFEFICINISVVIPCFCIYFVERIVPDGYKIGDKIKNNSEFFNHDLSIIPRQYTDLVHQSNQILKRFGLFRIENRILDEIIPDITFENLEYNKMTIFNCLFLNEPIAVI